MSTTELEALMDLLVDDDRAIQKAVTARLTALGEDAVVALEGAVDSHQARLRARARGVLNEIRTRSACAAFESFLEQDELDLEEALVGLARAEDPQLDVLFIRSTLERLGGTLAARLSGDPHEDAAALGRLMAEEEGFEGDLENFDDPRNSYVGHVLRRRRGIPITLSALYVIVGCRAGLRMEGVGMPLHFLVALRGDDERVLIDPFGGGRIMTREACRALLAGFHHTFRDDYLRPVGTRSIVRRMIANLVRTYHEREDGVRLARLYRFINILQDR